MLKKIAYEAWWAVAFVICIVISLAMRMGLPSRVVEKWLSKTGR